MAHKIVFGRSESVSADEIIRRLDVYSGDPGEGESWFEVHFKTSYLPDGASEVYGKEDGDLTDAALLQELFPFDVPEDVVRFLTYGDPASVFWFIETEKPPSKTIEGIQLMGPLTIERFNFEKQ